MRARGGTTGRRPRVRSGTPGSRVTSRMAETPFSGAAAGGGAVITSTGGAAVAPAAGADEGGAATGVVAAGGCGSRDRSRNDWCGPRRRGGCRLGRGSSTPEECPAGPRGRPRLRRLRRGRCRGAWRSRDGSRGDGRRGGRRCGRGRCGEARRARRQAWRRVAGGDGSSRSPDRCSPAALRFTFPCWGAEPRADTNSASTRKDTTASSGGGANLQVLSAASSAPDQGAPPSRTRAPPTRPSGSSVTSAAASPPPSAPAGHAGETPCRSSGIPSCRASLRKGEREGDGDGDAHPRRLAAHLGGLVLPLAGRRDRRLVEPGHAPDDARGLDLPLGVHDDVEDHDPADALGEGLLGVGRLDVLRLLRDGNSLAAGRERLLLGEEGGRSRGGDAERKKDRGERAQGLMKEV